MGDLFAAAGRGGSFRCAGLFVSFALRAREIKRLLLGVGFLLALRAHEKLKKREKNLEGFENYRKCAKAGWDISPCRKRQRNEETPARCASEK